MPSKNRIAGYPPDHIFEAFHKFKDDEKLTESKALLRILAGYFGVAENVAQEVSSPFVRVEQFQKVEQELLELRTLVSESKSNSLTDLQKKVVEIDIAVKEIQESQAPKQFLSTGELAQRLGMNGSSLSHWKSDNPKKNKSPQALLESTRAKDPEGIGWIFEKETGRFKPECPIGSPKVDLQGELLSSSSAITQPEA